MKLLCSSLLVCLIVSSLDLTPVKCGGNTKGSTSSSMMEPLLGERDSIETASGQKTEKKSKSSRDNSDTHRSICEIIESRQFLCKEYNTITLDGYILTIHRVINPLVAEDYRPKMKPILLQHGLMSTGADFLISSVNARPSPYPAVKGLGRADGAMEQPEVDESRPFDTQAHPNALAFYLANRGYDVFLANSRGNRYSREHIRLTSKDKEFWDFSYDQQIEYDLRSTIERVQGITRKKKIGYIGFSQGTLMGFGLLAKYPQYADIIEPFIALSPVAYLSHTVSPYKTLMKATPFLKRIKMVGDTHRHLANLAPVFCKYRWMQSNFCAQLYFLASGYNKKNFDESRVDVFMAQMASGTSMRNLAHYSQSVKTGRFAHFDYGSKTKNLAKYDYEEPPEYDVSKIRSKSIILFTANNDWITVPKDMKKLLDRLTVKPYAIFDMSKVDPKWNHIDFVYGKNTGLTINIKIEYVLEKFRDQ